MRPHVAVAVGEKNCVFGPTILDVVLCWGKFVVLSDWRIVTSLGLLLLKQRSGPDASIARLNLLIALF